MWHIIKSHRANGQWSYSDDVATAQQIFQATIVVSYSERTDITCAASLSVCRLVLIAAAQGSCRFGWCGISGGQGGTEAVELELEATLQLAASRSACLSVYLGVEHAFLFKTRYY
jgi:hypothetical protein